MAITFKFHPLCHIHMLLLGQSIMTLFPFHLLLYLTMIFAPPPKSPKLD